MRAYVSAHALRHACATTMYFVVLLMWLLAFGAYVPALLELPFFSESTPLITETTASEQPLPPTVAGVIVAALGGLLLIGIVLYVFKTIYAPAVEHSAEKVTEVTQRQILTNLKKRQPHMPVKKQREVKKWTATVIHLFGIVVPVLVVYFALPLSDETLRLLTQFAVTSLGLLASLLFVASRRFGRY